MTQPPVSGKRAKQGSTDKFTRGLPSVAEARQGRKMRASLPPRFWMWAIVFIGAGIIIWWKVDQGKIDEMKAELLGRQRAVVAELGPRWFPLRDKIEAWTSDCGQGAFVDHVEPAIVKTWDFRKLPGIYLRLAQSATKSPKLIRGAANKSLRDGFTACLLVVNNPNPLKGPKCVNTQSCPRGQWCNEYSHCAERSQPYNLRTAYKTLHLMSEEWVADIQQINNELILRGALATFEVVNKYDLPVATDLLQRSRYFMVVVDEVVDADESNLDELLPSVADAGAEDDRSIPTKPHPARVCVYRLEDDKKMLAVRRHAAGALHGSAATVTNPATRIAQQRQANSCALALAVRDEIGADRAGTVIEEDEPDGDDTRDSDAGSPAPSAAPSASAG